MLLGFRFAPRLRALSDQTLYRPRKHTDYGVLTPVLKKDIREDLIVRHWDDMNRLAASLKDGLVRPSLVVSKLQAMQRQNPLQQAIQELGRLGKTGHILHYVDDPPFRRRVLIGLNKRACTPWRAISPLGIRDASRIAAMRRNSTEPQLSVC